MTGKLEDERPNRSHPTLTVGCKIVSDHSLCFAVPFSKMIFAVGCKKYVSNKHFKSDGAK